MEGVAGVLLWCLVWGVLRRCYVAGVYGGGGVVGGLRGVRGLWRGVCGGSVSWRVCGGSRFSSAAAVG